MSDQHEVLVALVRHAGAAAAGEAVDWPLVEAGLARLCEDLQAPQKLRAALRRINDPETARVLADWFHGHEMRRMADRRAAERPGEKIVAPIQATGLGGLVTVAVLTAAGTLGPLAGAALGLAALATAGGASLGRWRLSHRADAALADAELMQKLAQIAKDGA